MSISGRRFRLEENQRYLLQTTTSFVDWVAGLAERNCVSRQTRDTVTAPNAWQPLTNITLGPSPTVIQ